MSCLALKMHLGLLFLFDSGSLSSDTVVLLWARAKWSLLRLLFSPAVPRPSLLFSLKEDWTRDLGFGFSRGEALNARKTERVEPSFLESSLPTAAAEPVTRATSVALNCPHLQQGSHNATDNNAVSQRGNVTLNLDVANLIPPME